MSYYQAMEQLQKLDSNKSVTGLGGVLIKQLQDSPYAQKRLDPIRKRIAELKEKEQQLLDDLAKLTGDTTPPSTETKLQGQVKRYLLPDNNKYLEAVGWRADGDQGELTLILGSDVALIPAPIRQFLGLKSGLVFPARKVGNDYIVDGKEYKAFVSRLTKIFTSAFLPQFLALVVQDKLIEGDSQALDAVKDADKSTQIEVREAKLVLTPIDDNLFMVSYMHAIISGNFDGKPSKEVVGLDETGQLKPWKYVLRPAGAKN